MSSKKRSSSTLSEESPSTPTHVHVHTTPSVQSPTQSHEKKQKTSANTAAKITRSSSSSSSSTSSPSSTSYSGRTHSSQPALTPTAYSTSASEYQQRFKAYANTTSEKATIILHQVLPRKVLELDYLVSSILKSGFESSVTFPFSEDGTFLPGREHEPIKSNPSVMKLIPQVKTEVLALIDHLGALKLMIQLRIPAVDDGNNLGVEIQEETINELAKVEDVAFQYLEKISAYLANRTRIAAKCMKYPSILDYWQAIRELDSAFHTDLQLHLVEMRNSYAAIHDLLLKNEERIKNPRGEADGEAKNRRHAFV